jgi:hypothetical protein
MIVGAAQSHSSGMPTRVAPRARRSTRQALGRAAAGALRFRCSQQPCRARIDPMIVGAARRSHSSGMPTPAARAQSPMASRRMTGTDIVRYKGGQTSRYIGGKITLKLGGWAMVWELGDEVRQGGQAANGRCLELWRGSEVPRGTTQMTVLRAGLYPGLILRTATATAYEGASRRRQGRRQRAIRRRCEPPWQVCGASARMGRGGSRQVHWQCKRCTLKIARMGEDLGMADAQMGGKGPCVGAAGRGSGGTTVRTPLEKGSGPSCKS